MYLYLARCSVPIAVAPRIAGKGTKVHSQLFYKIGISHDLDERMRAMQTGCPLNIRFIATMKMPSRMSAREFERALHARFVDLRVRGEWFRLKPIHERALKLLAEEWPAADPIARLEEIIRGPASEQMVAELNLLKNAG